MLIAEKFREYFGGYWLSAKWMRLYMRKSYQCYWLQHELKCERERYAWREAWLRRIREWERKERMGK